MKRQLNILIYALAATGLTACATAGRHAEAHRSPIERAAVAVDSLYGSGVPTADTASLASMPWRTLFADPYLQALIDTGLQRNADLLTAQQRVVQAQAALRQATRAFVPTLAAGAQGQLAGYGSSAAGKTYQLALSSQWEVDIAGRLTATKRAAAETLEERRAARQAVRTQLVATIAGSYYNLLMLDAQLDISRRTAATWAETVRALRAQKQVGLSTEAAVTQAEANRFEVEAATLTLQQNISRQENALSTLVGLTPRHIARGRLSAVTFPERLSTGLPLQLLAARPDVRQAEHALRRAGHATQAARAAFYPQLTLSGTAGWANSNGATLTSPGRFLWNALASLTQPILNQGRNRAQLATARAEEQAALIAFRQKLLDAGAEVNNALTQWQTATQQIAVDSSRIAALSRTLTATEQLMRHSSNATYLEVLTAQQALLAAKLSHEQNVLGKIQGVINLYHALGGGE